MDERFGGARTQLFMMLLDLPTELLVYHVYPAIDEVTRRLLPFTCKKLMAVLGRHRMTAADLADMYDAVVADGTASQFVWLERSWQLPFKCPAAFVMIACMRGLGDLLSVIMAHHPELSGSEIEHAYRECAKRDALDCAQVIYGQTGYQADDPVSYYPDICRHASFDFYVWWLTAMVDPTVWQHRSCSVVVYLLKCGQLDFARRVMMLHGLADVTREMAMAVTECGAICVLAAFIATDLGGTPSDEQLRWLYEGAIAHADVAMVNYMAAHFHWNPAWLTEELFREALATTCIALLDWLYANATPTLTSDYYICRHRVRSGSYTPVMDWLLRHQVPPPVYIQKHHFTPFLDDQWVVWLVYHCPGVRFSERFVLQAIRETEGTIDHALTQRCVDADCFRNREIRAYMHRRQLH